MADLPRVTAILAALGLAGDFDGIDPEVLAAAQARGTAVHEATENDHYGLVGPEALAGMPDDVRERYRGYRRFMDDTRAVPIVSEYPVEHRLWGYRGHIDRVEWIDDRRVERSLDDFKCVAELDVRVVARQLAAYRLAWNASRPREALTRVRAIQLLPGDYRIWDKEIQDVLREAEQEFLAAVVVYRAWMREGRV